MTIFYLHGTLPVLHPPTEQIRVNQQPASRVSFPIVKAPPLKASRVKTVSHPHKKQFSFQIEEDAFQQTHAAKSGTRVAAIRPVLLEPSSEVESLDRVTPLSKAHDVKAKILEGNRILAAFNEQGIEKVETLRQKPEKTELVVLSKPDEKNKPLSIKKIPIPFQAKGFPKEMLKNFLKGQINANFLKDYVLNRFCLHINHAKFSITHFHQGSNNHFSESVLQFTRQEKKALQETAQAYGYDPKSPEEMEQYYQELFQLQAELKGSNKTEEWGVSYHFKKGVLKTKPLELPEKESSISKETIPDSEA